MNLQYLIPLKPENSIAYFQQKKQLESWSWPEVWQENHAKAFTVAKSAGMDVLTDIQSALNDALNEGKTFQQFKKELIPTLTKKGWLPKIDEDLDPNDEKAVKKATARRLDTIYHTNMSVAYSAGEYKSLVEASVVSPYWMYVAIKDGRTRPQHLKMDGKILHHTHPFWTTFYPPNGWGCRCYVVALTATQVKAMIKSGAISKDTVIGLDQGVIEWEDVVISAETGEMRERAVFKLGDITLKADAGWSYNPGAAGLLEDSAFKKALNLPAGVRQQFVADMSKQAVLHPDMWDGFVERSINMKKQGFEISAGCLPFELLKKYKLSSATIIANDNVVQHIMRDAKKAKITEDQLRDIPNILTDYDNIYQDKNDKNILVYTKDIDAKKTIKVVVAMNWRNKALKTTVNSIRSAGIVDIHRMNDTNKYRKVTP